VSFINQVRSGAITQPNQPRFSLSKWKEAYAAVDTPSEDCKRLYAAGIWFDNELTSVRSLLSVARHKGLKAPLAARLLVAMCNRRFHILQAASRKSIENATGDLVLAGALSARRLPIGPGGVDVEAGAVLEGGVEALKYPLADALNGENSHFREFASGSDGLSTLQRVAQLAADYHSLEHEWNQCVWGSSGVVVAKNGTAVLGPFDRREAIASAARDHRSDALRQEVAIRTMNHYQRSPFERSIVERTTLSARRSKRGGLQVRRGWKRPVPPFDLIMGAVAEDLYWNGLLVEELPSYPGLTIRHLLRCWRLLASLAETLLPAQEPIITKPSSLYRYAPSIRQTDLVAALAKVLDGDHDAAKAVAQIFTHPSGKPADPWLYPVVAWSPENVSINVPVALTSSLVMVIEHWMTVGGIKLEKRGDAFETYARERLVETDANEAIRSSYYAHPMAFEIVDGKVKEEVDALFIVGRLVFICEVKCTVSANSPRRRFRALKRLRKGVRQAKRKAQAAARNTNLLPAEVRSRLQPDSQFIPLVVTNLWSLAGSPIDGVAVADLPMLNVALTMAKVVMLADSRDEEGAPGIPIYSDIESAEQYLAGFLKHPKQIDLRQRWVRRAVYPIAISSWADRRIVQLAYIVDLTSVEDTLNEVPSSTEE